MRKVSKQDLSKLQGRGKTITPQGKRAAPAPANQKQPVAQASMAAVIKQVQHDNMKFIKEFGEDVKKIVGRKRKPWKFTVKRNNQGTITTVLADPIE